MAFDCFNSAGSLFVEGQSDPKIRASAQGLFMMMTNGVGAVFGSLASGFIIEHWFTHADPMRSSQTWTADRSEEHTSELQSLMRISYAVFCLKKKNNHTSKLIINTSQ